MNNFVETSSTETQESKPVKAVQTILAQYWDGLLTSEPRFLSRPHEVAFPDFFSIKSSELTAGTPVIVTNNFLGSNTTGINWAGDQPSLYFIHGESNQAAYQRTSRENELNKARRKEFQEKYCPKLKLLIRDEPFEAGVISRADLLVREILDINASVAKESLEHLFLTSLRAGDFEIASGVIELVGRLGEDEIEPQGTTMAVAALAVQNTRLQEAAVRAFENWDSESGALVLEKIEFKSGWVKDYAVRVVSAIKG